MRFISKKCLEKGMMTDKPIYNINGSLLLAKGTRLTSSHIDRLQKLEASGLYINSHLSRDIEEEELVKKQISTHSSFVLDNIYNCKVKNKESIKSTTKSILSKEVVVVNLVDLKKLNQALFDHSLNVLMYSLMIGSTLRLNSSEMYELGMGAALHKIGKTFIDTSDIEIIEKDELIDYTQYFTKAFMRKIPKNSLNAILDQYERFDGQGLRGKKGSHINKLGRIITMCNIYHCLLNLYSPANSLEYLMANVDAIFDIDLIQAFYLTIALYPTNSEILLSNGQIASVKENNPGFPSRPKIIVNNEIIDLSEERFNLVITEQV